jgi:hypothetical protein
MQPKHNCPNWCHKCPELGGDILPICWGSVAWGSSDLSHCCCEHLTLCEELLSDIDRLIRKWEINIESYEYLDSAGANLRNLKKIRSKMSAHAGEEESGNTQVEDTDSISST